MIVVADTSPINYLVLIDQPDLFTSYTAMSSSPPPHPLFAFSWSSCLSQALTFSGVLFALNSSSTAGGTTAKKYWKTYREEVQ